MKNPGIDDKLFEIVLNTDFFSNGNQFGRNSNELLEVIDKPIKTHWIYNILYYLSLGFIDKRGYKYKVKIIK